MPHVLPRAKSFKNRVLLSVDGRKLWFRIVARRADASGFFHSEALLQSTYWDAGSSYGRFWVKVL